MLPVGQGQGKIWLHAQFLCDTKYVVSEPIRRTGALRVQRVLLTVEDKHCDTLLDSYQLTLVLADGTHHHIPRPIRNMGLGGLEVYVESRH